MSLMKPEELRKYMQEEGNKYHWEQIREEEKYKKLMEIKMLEHQMKMEQVKAAVAADAASRPKDPLMPDMWKTIMTIQKEHIETQAKLIASLEEQIKQLKGGANG